MNCYRMGGYWTLNGGAQNWLPERYDTRFYWTTLTFSQAGTYTISTGARSYPESDPRSAAGWAVPRAITVTVAPEVTLTSPHDDVTLPYYSGYQYNYRIAATGMNCSYMTAYVNGVEVFSATGNSLSQYYIINAPGVYEIYVVGTASDGSTATTVKRTVRAPLATSRTVWVELQVNQSFTSAFTDWNLRALEAFTKARIPFQETWSIHLSFYMPQEITTDGEACPHTQLDQVCSTAQGACGSEAQCGSAHHKNGDRTLIRSLDQTTLKTPLSLLFSGHTFCYLKEAVHTEAVGFGCIRDKGAVAYTFLTEPNDGRARRYTIRVAQHELSHNYGCLDRKGPDSDDPERCTGPCIMSGGWDRTSDDAPDIWCGRCKKDFDPGLF